MTWRSDPHVQRWLAIGAGLLIGLGAKYAIWMQDKRRFGVREFGVDLLLLAANALMAYVWIGWAGLTGESAVAAAALFGASSDRVVRIVRKAFERRIERAVAVLLTDPDRPTTVPPSTEEVEVQVVRTPKPELRGIERFGEQILTTTESAELEALLKRLRDIN